VAKPREGCADMDGHEAKALTDGAALTVTFSGMMGWMTPAATLIGSLLGIVWMCIRIYETETVQKMLGRNAVNK
jgi:hypothetical protein